VVGCGKEAVDAAGELVAGQRELGVWLTEVAGRDGRGDVGHEFADSGGPGADGLLGEVAKDPHEVGGGRAGDAVFCRVPGSAVVERWGLGWGLDVVGLPVPEVGGVPLPQCQVVEVEAVGGGCLSGAGGVLPPEAGA
jgi:hypothetical protein